MADTLMSLELIQSLKNDMDEVYGFTSFGGWGFTSRFCELVETARAAHDYKKTIDSFKLHAVCRVDDNFVKECDFHREIRQERDLLKEENERFLQAVGLASTIAPHMEINVNDPIGMMQIVCDAVGQLRNKLQVEAAENTVLMAENEKLCEELEAALIKINRMRAMKQHYMQWNLQKRTELKEQLRVARVDERKRCADLINVMRHEGVEREGGGGRAPRCYECEDAIRSLGDTE